MGELRHFDHLLISATDTELANLILEPEVRDRIRGCRFSITDAGRRALRNSASEPPHPDDVGGR